MDIYSEYMKRENGVNNLFEANESGYTFGVENRKESNRIEMCI